MAFHCLILLLVGSVCTLQRSHRSNSSISKAQGANSDSASFCGSGKLNTFNGTRNGINSLSEPFHGATNSISNRRGRNGGSKPLHGTTHTDSKPSHRTTSSTSKIDTPADEDDDWKTPKKRFIVSVYGIPQERNENLMKILEEVGQEMFLKNPMHGIVKAYRSKNPRDLTIKPIVVQLFNKTIKDLWVNEFTDKDLYIEKFYLIGGLPKQIHGNTAIFYPGYVAPNTTTTQEPESNRAETDHNLKHTKPKLYRFNNYARYELNDSGELKLHDHRGDDYNETSSYEDQSSDESTNTAENPECTYCQTRLEKIKKKRKQQDEEYEDIEDEDVDSIEMFEAKE